MALTVLKMQNRETNLRNAFLRSFGAAKSQKKVERTRPRAVFNLQSVPKSRKKDAKRVHAQFCSCNSIAKESCETKSCVVLELQIDKTAK